MLYLLLYFSAHPQRNHLVPQACHLLLNPRYYMGVGIHCKGYVVRCPRHTIQFSGHGYAEHIKEVLGLVGIKTNNWEWKHYESWMAFSLW
jgi:hypothetical protein